MYYYLVLRHINLFRQVSGKKSINFRRPGIRTPGMVKIRYCPRHNRRKSSYPVSLDFGKFEYTLSNFVLVFFPPKKWRQTSCVVPCTQTEKNPMTIPVIPVVQLDFLGS
uniref:Uncharacterized protein n=1 Tax=Cacopsylla melanoneura TaxID=428564 RepID=A0A8D8M3D1_9HEMI